MYLNIFLQYVNQKETVNIYILTPIFTRDVLQKNLLLQTCMKSINKMILSFTRNLVFIPMIYHWYQISNKNETLSG